ncbi:MAG: hypothetical protein MI974_11575 [Chitinophagales bacterium]|nr:hypothetical protein [Chitinophagales bacterium]
MKRIFPFLFLGVVLLFTACQDDDDGPQPQPTDDLLAYDGDNNTGPLLDAGNYEAAVLFPANIIQDYTGRKLNAVTFFIGELPANCEVRVYEGTTNDGRPSNLIFASDVTNGLVAPSWNRLFLDPPITLAEDDIWLSIALTHNQQQQSIGCDAGPNQANGDWLYDNSDGEWITYIQRTQESVNWNIRGELE